MELYVVTTGLPGPGVSTLIDEAGRELIASAAGEQERAAVIRETLDAVHAKLRRSPPCEFVELEDEHGFSVGPQSSGAQWDKRWLGEPPLFHLGPFAPRPQDDAGAEVDYDRLNAASRTLYDAAFAVGKRVGDEEARSEMAERHAEGLLELAARLLEGVVGWPRETDADLREQRRQMQLVRMVLGATPYTLSLDKAIRQASKALRRTDAIDLSGAVECQRAVERLREAMRSGDAS